LLAEAEVVIRPYDETATDSMLQMMVIPTWRRARRKR